MNLIDRDEVMKHKQRLFGEDEHSEEYITDAVRCETILSIPTVESIPIVHAHWKDEDENCWECSNCGLMWYMSNDDNPIENEMYYCPKCAAKMDEITSK
jgi:Zn finger protein HypA/HybF involved in hydrogenase expression